MLPCCTSLLCNIRTRLLALSPSPLHFESSGMPHPPLNTLPAVVIMCTQDLRPSFSISKLPYILTWCCAALGLVCLYVSKIVQLSKEMSPKALITKHSLLFRAALGVVWAESNTAEQLVQVKVDLPSGLANTVAAANLATALPSSIHQGKTGGPRVCCKTLTWARICCAQALCQSS